MNDAQTDMKIELSEIINNGLKVIYDKVFVLNDMYYVDSINEVLQVNKKIKKKQEEKVDVSKEDKKDEASSDNDLGDTSNNKTEDKVHSDKDNKNQDTNNEQQEGSKKPVTEENTSEENTSEENSSNTGEEQQEDKTEDNKNQEKPNESAKDSISGIIKFTKPDSWDDKESVYVYLYYNENDTEEYSRVKMSNYVNEMYTFEIKDIDKSKDTYIVFTNGKEIYPDGCKVDLDIGKTYISD